MDNHKIQLGRDEKTNLHYACMIDGSGSVLYKTPNCKTVQEALKHIESNTPTSHTKRKQPTTSFKEFPEPVLVNDRRYCSS